MYPLFFVSRSLVQIQTKHYNTINGLRLTLLSQFGISECCWHNKVESLRKGGFNFFLTKEKFMIIIYQLYGQPFKWKLHPLSILPSLEVNIMIIKKVKIQRETGRVFFLFFLRQVTFSPSLIIKIIDPGSFVSLRRLKGS